MRRLSLAAACFFFCLATSTADTYLALPFSNLSKNANLNWIGESLSEAVREALSAEGLMALDRDDRVEAYRRLSIRPYSILTKASVVKIGEELDAEHVISGYFDLKPVSESASKSRGSLQVTARLVDLKHMQQGPEFHEVAALEDLATLQDHLAWQVLQFVKPKSAPSEADFRKRHPVVRVDAIENYIRGLLAPSADEKHRFFTQAARLDSHYSQPCFQLGRLLWTRNEYKSAADWFQRLTPTDPHYREANFFLGLCRYHSGDFAGAQAAFQLVVRVVPLNEVFNNLGAAQSRANLPEALDNFRKALEGDESDPAYHFNVGYALWKQGSFEAAAVSFRAALERNPDDAQATLLLDRCVKRSGPRPGDPATAGLERLKMNYEESAYWQLRAVLQPEK